MSEIEKMNLESTDLVDSRVAQIKQMFPEIVTERAGGGAQLPGL